MRSKQEIVEIGDNTWIVSRDENGVIREVRDAGNPLDEHHEPSQALERS
jgi:hypothetical protein